jgi:hypothetical protein
MRDMTDNDNKQVPDFIGRAIDEIELVLLDFLPQEKAELAAIRIIPIVGKLSRDVMDDISKDIMEIFRATQSGTD